MDSFFNVICFFAGMLCMMTLWFWHDLKHSDYERGYLDGCHDTAELLGEEDDET